MDDFFIKMHKTPNLEKENQIMLDRTETEPKACWRASSSYSGLYKVAVGGK